MCSSVSKWSCNLCWKYQFWAKRWNFTLYKMCGRPWLDSHWQQKQLTSLHRSVICYCKARDTKNGVVRYILFVYKKYTISNQYWVWHGVQVARKDPEVSSFASELWLLAWSALCRLLRHATPTFLKWENLIGKSNTFAGSAIAIFWLPFTHVGHVQDLLW